MGARCHWTSHSNLRLCQPLAWLEHLQPPTTVAALVTRRTTFALLGEGVENKCVGHPMLQRREPIAFSYHRKSMRSSRKHNRRAMRGLRVIPMTSTNGPTASNTHDNGHPEPQHRRACTRATRLCTTSRTTNTLDSRRANTLEHRRHHHQRHEDDNDNRQATNARCQTRGCGTMSQPVLCSQLNATDPCDVSSHL